MLSDPIQIFYLTGFRGSAGIAVLRSEGGILWVDPRYTLQAQEQAQGVEVVEVRQSLLKAAAEWLKRHRRAAIGYEETHLTVAQFNELKSGIAGSRGFVPASDWLTALRMIKDKWEIARIREAARVTSKALTEVVPRIRPGVSESDLAAEIEYRMRRHGAEGAAFETIVASGSRAALPHARPSGKLLENGDLVILDLGAILGGYAADMTRTVCLGKANRRIQALYREVLESQQRGTEAVRPGVTAGQVDAAARRSLERAKLGRYFVHSTGHGVGLEIHERPRLGRGDETRLEAGQVVTIEPGVYIEGLGGIRIEDTVLVGDKGPEILTSASKDDWVLA